MATDAAVAPAHEDASGAPPQKSEDGGAVAHLEVAPADTSATQVVSPAAAPSEDGRSQHADPNEDIASLLPPLPDAACTPTAGSPLLVLPQPSAPGHTSTEPEPPAAAQDADVAVDFLPSTPPPPTFPGNAPPAAAHADNTEAPPPSTPPAATLLEAEPPATAEAALAPPPPVVDPKDEEIRRLREQLAAIQAASGLHALTVDNAPRVLQRKPQESSRLELPSGMLVRDAWMLYCCGDAARGIGPLREVCRGTVGPEATAAQFKRVVLAIRAAVDKLGKWMPSPTVDEAMDMLADPRVVTELLQGALQLRGSLGGTALSTMRNNLNSVQARRRGHADQRIVDDNAWDNATAMATTTGGAAAAVSPAVASGSLSRVEPAAAIDPRVDETHATPPPLFEEPPAVVPPAAAAQQECTTAAHGTARKSRRKRRSDDLEEGDEDATAAAATTPSTVNPDAAPSKRRATPRVVGELDATTSSMGGAAAAATSSDKARGKRRATVDAGMEQPSSSKLRRGEDAGTSVVDSPASAATHCALLALPPTASYLPSQVQAIDDFLDAQKWNRRVHVVPPDGSCSVHTLAYFTAIPWETLRWLALVEMAMLPVLARAIDVPAAAVADARYQALADRKPASLLRAMNAVMRRSHHEEAPVISLLCDLLGLPLGVLMVVDADSRPMDDWRVTMLGSTTADGTELDWSNVDHRNAVRLAVFYCKHYCPCVLANPVDPALVPPCRDLSAVLLELHTRALRATTIGGDGRVLGAAEGVAVSLSLLHGVIVSVHTDQLRFRLRFHASINVYVD